MAERPLRAASVTGACALVNPGSSVGRLLRCANQIISSSSYRYSKKILDVDIVNADAEPVRGRLVNLGGQPSEPRPVLEFREQGLRRRHAKRHGGARTQHEHDA